MTAYTTYSGQGRMNFEISVNGEKVSCRYLEKKRIKNAYLRFSGDTLVVIARDKRKAGQIIRDNQVWIEKHYASVREAVRLFDRNSMLISGKRFVVLFRYSGHLFVEREKEVIVLNAGSESSAEHLADRWLAESSMALASDMVREKSSIHGIAANGIDMCRGSRWGSCSPDKRLRFNRYLCMLPNEIAGYVVSHELAHTVELNHSAGFWRKVQELCPDYKSLRKALKSYDSSRRGMLYPGLQK